MGTILKIILLASFLFISLAIPLRVLAGGGIGADSINISLEKKINDENPNNIKIFADHTPKLAEVAAFHIALIAFFIPLSVEMVGRISERYGSSVISNYYKRELVPQIIFYLSIFNILLSVFLIFFSNSIRLLDYVSLGIFTITLILIIAFLKSLYLYLTDIDSVIGKLTQDVKNIIQ